MNNYRKVTNRLIELMDEGILDPRAVADAALTYLSEDDVAEMARINELIIDYEDEDDEDDVTFADLIDDYEDDEPPMRVVHTVDGPQWQVIDGATRTHLSKDEED